MALTPQAVTELKAKIEPREPGTITATGLHKLANGVLIARHSTEDGTRDEADMQAAMQADSDRISELEALREQQEASAKSKKKGKKKTEPVVIQQPKAPEPKSITVKMAGIGDIPTQYANVNFGDSGVALLGLTKMSFIPKITDPSSDEPPTLFELSPRPGTKFVYLGNTVTLDNGVKQLVIYEAPEGEE